MYVYIYILILILFFFVCVCVCFFFLGGGGAAFWVVGESFVLAFGAHFWFDNALSLGSEGPSGL